MIDLLILYPLAGGLLVAIIAGLLGPFVIWNNMSYFGDALSHSALLGVTIGILFNINVTVTIIFVSLFFAFLFSNNQKKYSNDTTLAIITFCAVSLAVIIASVNHIKIDLMGLLFGDILTIDLTDISCLLISVIIIIIWLRKNLSLLIFMSICPDLLKAEGGNIKAVKLSFSLILSLFVAIAFKIVGILMITAMLILPASCALQISKSPYQMIRNSIIIGCISTITGIYASFEFDIPMGPSIIVSSFIFFLGTAMYRRGN